MATVALIQARMGSTRFPGKVLADLGGRAALDWVVAAARAIPGVDRVAVATSRAAGDDALVDWCAVHDVACHRGPEDDVLARFIDAARAEGADIVLRLTGDCPFLDPAVCGQILYLMKQGKADYATNRDPASWPDGLDCEVMTMAALETAGAEAALSSEREHVTPFLRHNRFRFRVANLPCPLPGLARERWTLDTPADLEFLNTIASRLALISPPSFIDVLDVLDAVPDLRAINAAGVRDESFAADLVDEAIAQAQSTDGDRSYGASSQLLRRAEATIPLASQTFSKSRIQYPEKAAPLFLTHGDGALVWDVDGNEYVDMVGGLFPLVLGYCDPDVDGAVRAQLDRGISFSLATTLEADLAERLVDLIPCAEKVRFGKNGTDATSAAVRLARAYTGRDRIAVCGYHGWQDWYIAVTSRNKGIPQAVRDLSHVFKYNDLGSLAALLDAHSGEFAAVIMEPMNMTEPAPGFLEGVRDLTQRHGTLLVFDEVITGFRFALRGAQSLFGVTPDLASFGKAMGNGMPISAIVGRAEIMKEMENIFFSGTFGGEALSLAAAIAVIDKMKREPVIETLYETGAALTAAVNKRIAAHGLDDVLSLNGRDCSCILAFKDKDGVRKEAIRTLFLKEMLAAGVLINSAHSMCYAHDKMAVARVVAAYDHALGRLSAALESGNFERNLGVPVIKPVFQIR